jgi:hypothetical protein
MGAFSGRWTRGRLGARSTTVIQLGAQGKIEQEERRNGGQPRRNHSVFIFMLPCRLILLFLRFSVSLVQFIGWLFCEREKIRPEKSSQWFGLWLGWAVFSCS